MRDRVGTTRGQRGLTVVPGLVQAKLHPGVIPDFVVDRPRLQAALDQVWCNPLNLVVAPAGYGKSTLLGQWAADQPEGDLAWLALDARDLDPVRLGSHLIGALGSVCAAVGAQSRQALGAAPNSLGDEVVDLLLDELFTLERDVVLVLEDIDRVEGSALFTDLDRLIWEAPPMLHVVASGRVDPDLGLHRYRSRDELAELRVDDLRFDWTEATEVVARLCGRQLHDDEAAHLAHITEGWPVAVQLAAISLRGSGGSVLEFGGTDRNIVDYLSAEVLGQEAEEVQTFLQDASALEAMSGELCDAAMGRPGTAALLADLEQRALFITPVQAEPGWYRLHRLVREFLLNDLRAADPERAIHLWRRAARWHLEHDDPGQAVSYLVEARAWDELTVLIDAHGRTMWDQGYVATLLHLLDSMPESVRRRSAHLRLIDVGVRLIAGRPEGAAAGLADLERQPDLSTGEAVVADAFRCALVHELNPSSSDVDRADRALARLTVTPPEELPDILGSTTHADIASVLHNSTAQARLLLGDGSAAEHARNAAAAPASTRVTYQLHGHGVFAITEALQARPTSGDSHVRYALDLAARLLSADHPSTLFALVGRAAAARMHDELEDAIAHAEAALVLAERWNRWPMASFLIAERALVDYALGDFDDATSWVRRIRQLPLPSACPLVEGRFRSVELRVRWARGDTGDLWSIVDPTIMNASWELASAAIAVAVDGDDVGRARKYLDAWPTACAPFGEVERSLATVAVEHAEGDAATAQMRLSEVLARTAPERAIRPYLDAGETVRRLLSDEEQLARSRTHVTEILRAARRSRPADGGLIDPLSARELEVLRYLPTRMSNAHIAEALYVSTNTVKTHVKHIYQKLNATDRDEAIGRAEEIGLL